MSEHRGHMNRRRVMAGLGAGTLAGFGLGGCDSVTATHRFRYTLEFEVDGRSVSASSVLEEYFRGRGGPEGVGRIVIGVTPIVLLGPYGELIVQITSFGSAVPWLFQFYSSHQVVRDSRDPRPYLRDARRTTFRQKGFGQLFWFPSGSGLREWVPIKDRKATASRPPTVDLSSPSDLSRIISPNVRYVQSIIEPTRDRVITRLQDVPLEPRPRWLPHAA